MTALRSLMSHRRWRKPAGSMIVAQHTHLPPAPQREPAESPAARSRLVTVYSRGLSLFHSCHVVQSVQKRSLESTALHQRFGHGSGPDMTRCHVVLVGSFRLAGLEETLHGSWLLHGYTTGGCVGERLSQRHVGLLKFGGKEVGLGAIEWFRIMWGERWTERCK